ncbi:MAG: D-alanine--D-alanine ligase family protein [Candidatus Saccharibacteria bacterium]
MNLQMQRTTVLLLFGGESTEHEVSISSARNVYAAMDDTKFDVVLCFIDKNGRWWLLEEFALTIDTHQSPQLEAALGGKSFLTLPGNKVITPDVIFPVLHGRNGEDGSVQGLAQLLHIPIVGCDVTASALAMDKIATKQILEANGIDIVPYETHRKGELAPDIAKINMTLGSPLFVKPARSGSSVGVSKVYGNEKFTEALEKAHQHSDVVLIERAITARELEVAVLGNPPHHKVSGVGEIKASGDFYSYESKYDLTSTSSVIIPAEIEDELKSKVTELAGRVYEILGCTGMARVDFFLSDDQKLYVNEVNTIPGFTNISMYPKLWREEGVSYLELIEELIASALKA